MNNFKRWEDLTFTDDFIFSQVMKNEDICKSLIETILKIKVGKIEFLTSQYEIEIEPKWVSQIGTVEKYPNFFSY